MQDDVVVTSRALQGPLGALDPSGGDRAHRTDDVVHRLHGLSPVMGRFPCHDGALPVKDR